MIFWIAPAFKLAPYVLGALDFLRKQALALVTPPAPIGIPYTPPFRGGQQVGVFYSITAGWLVQNDDGTTYIDFGIRYAGQYRGAIKRIFTQVINGDINAYVEDSSGIKFLFSGVGGKTKGYLYSITLEPSNGVPDTTNLPNPNPAPSISDDGIADSFPPDLDSAPIVIEAVPPIILPSFAAALAAALAAAKNALNVLDAIKGIANALELLSDLLNKKNAEENKKEKEKKESQDTIRYEFGSIQRDGFLRLYPDSNLAKYVAQQLDISFVVIPTYLGKYFGKFSPNYYRYKPTSNLISSLGYISFVSPTFGILSTHHLEFRRTSIKVPENSIGFYYHLGLDGALTANAFAFYTKPKP